MRSLSVSMSRSGRTPTVTLPAEGSKLRLVYDTLYEYRGRPLPTDELTALCDLVAPPNLDKRGKSIASTVEPLRNIWGCDIRKINGHLVLVGEWCGKVYVDYTQPAAERAEVAA